MGGGEADGERGGEEEGEKEGRDREQEIDAKEECGLRKQEQEEAGGRIGQEILVANLGKEMQDRQKNVKKKG